MTSVSDFDGRPGALTSPTCTPYGSDDAQVDVLELRLGVATVTSTRSPRPVTASTRPGTGRPFYYVGSGTSPAAAHVAGLVALCMGEVGSGPGAVRGQDPGPGHRDHARPCRRLRRRPSRLRLLGRPRRLAVAALLRIHRPRRRRCDARRNGAGGSPHAATDRVWCCWRRHCSAPSRSSSPTPRCHRRGLQPGEELHRRLSRRGSRIRRRDRRAGEAPARVRRRLPLLGGPRRVRRATSPAPSSTPSATTPHVAFVAPDGSRQRPRRPARARASRCRPPACAGSGPRPGPRPARRAPRTSP